MLTPPQVTIIKEVCSIQFRSLEDVLIKIDLGSNSENEPYEEILHDIGCSRKDFDEELIDTYQKFRGVYEEPEKVYELSEIELLIFKHILHKWEHKWIGDYPKALANLWNKLFLFTAINEMKHGTSKN